EDLSDSRFKKAVAALEERKLIEIVTAPTADAGKQADLRKLDEKSQEIAQEVVLTLDFTKLERGLLNAAKATPPAPEAPRAQQAKPGKSPAAPAGTATSTRAGNEAKASAKLAAELRPKIEAELRASMQAALRPKIEEELRSKLISALRPVLEAEIRTKLTAALVPRVAHELRSRLAKPAAGAETPPADAADGPVGGPHSRLLECIREGIFQTNLAGNCVYANARWTLLSGYRSEEIAGRPFAQFFVPEDQRGVANYLEGVARGGAVPLIVEARLARKAGAPLQVAIRAAALTTADGACAGVCGTMRGTA
ncbi:MAG: PAS domain-containing protein, partial [Burkholderiales bacterium]